MSGFFGVVSHKRCVEEVFYGTDYHSHLGTKRGGLAIYNDETKTYHRDIHNLENSYFRTKFDDEIKDYDGNSGIGCISDTDAQPILRRNSIGTYAVATVAKINNIDDLATELMQERMLSFSEQSDGNFNQTELIALMIHEGRDFVDGIRIVQEKVKGSCSMIVLYKDQIIAGRDRLGRTPIVIGSKTDGDGLTSYCVASESTSFLNLDYRLEHILGPGEIVSVTKDGYQVLGEPLKESQICSFLWVYYGYPPSVYDEGINVDTVRYRCGEMLAKSDCSDADGRRPGQERQYPKTGEIDFVAGIPDSGVGHALGYSNCRHIPYMRPYVKYTPTWPRSFMPQSQKQRELVAKMKLIPNKDIINGKSGVFLDDSIVRGTQLRDNVKDLVNCGIKGVHMRIACPPLIYPCEFLNFSRSRSNMELATRKAVEMLILKKLTGRDDVKLDEAQQEPLKSECEAEMAKVDWGVYADPSTEEYRDMVDEIRAELGLTTLKFQRLDDLVSAIGLPKRRLCTHCFDGSSWGHR